jgi:predicted DNA-binding protein with PD1-like motif
MKRTEIQPGHEIRGFVIRLYPTAEQIERMRELQEEQRIAVQSNTCNCTVALTI